MINLENIFLSKLLRTFCSKLPCCLSESMYNCSQNDHWAEFNTGSAATALLSVKILYYHLLRNKLFVPNKKHSEIVKVWDYSGNRNSRSLSNVTSLCHPLVIPYPCEPLQPCSPENTTLLLLGTSHAAFETTFARPWDWHLSHLLWLALSWSAWSFALTFLGGKTNFLKFRWLQPDLYLNNFVEYS